jgi:hypothetical protein
MPFEFVLEAVVATLDSTVEGGRVIELSSISDGL